jgi:hypothetical protein
MCLASSSMRISGHLLWFLLHASHMCLQLLRMVGEKVEKQKVFTEDKK